MSDGDHQHARFGADCHYGYSSASQLSGITDEPRRALMPYTMDSSGSHKQDCLGLDRFRSPGGRQDLDAQLLAGDIPDHRTRIPLDPDQYSEMFGPSSSYHASTTPHGDHWTLSEAEQLTGQPATHYYCGQGDMPACHQPPPETLHHLSGSVMHSNSSQAQQQGVAHRASDYGRYVEWQDMERLAGTDHDAGLRGYFEDGEEHRYVIQAQTGHTADPRRTRLMPALSRPYPDGRSSARLPASCFDACHHSGPPNSTHLGLPVALPSSAPSGCPGAQPSHDSLLEHGLGTLAIRDCDLVHEPHSFRDPRESAYFHSQDSHNIYAELDPSPAGEENLLAEIEGQGTFVSSMNAYPASKAYQYPPWPYPHHGPPPVHPAYVTADPYDGYLHPSLSRSRLPPISLPTPDPSARLHRRYLSDVNPYHMHTAAHHQSATQAPSQAKPARDHDAFYRGISDLLADEPDLHRLLVEETHSILSSDPFSNAIGIDFGFGIMRSLNSYGLQKTDLGYMDAFCIDALYLFEQALRHDSLLTDKERLRRWSQRLSWENVADSEKKEHWLSMLPLDQPRIGIGPGGWWAYSLHSIPLDYSCGYYRSLIGKTGMFASKGGAFHKGAIEAHYPLTGNLKSRYPMWRDGGLGLGRSLIHWLDGRPALATPGASQHNSALADANAAQAQAHQPHEPRRTREEITRQIRGQNKIASLLAAVRAETSISLPPDMNPALRPRPAPQTRMKPSLSTPYNDKRPLVNSSGHLDPHGDLRPGPQPGRLAYSFPSMKYGMPNPLRGENVPHSSQGAAGMDTKTKPVLPSSLKVQSSNVQPSLTRSRSCNQGSFQTPYLKGSNWGQPPPYLRQHRTGDAQNASQAATGSSGVVHPSSIRMAERPLGPAVQAEDKERHLPASDSDSTRPLPGSASSKTAVNRESQPPVRSKGSVSRENQAHRMARKGSGHLGSDSVGRTWSAGLPEPPKMVMPSHMRGTNTRQDAASARSNQAAPSHPFPPTNVDT